MGTRTEDPEGLLYTITARPRCPEWELAMIRVLLSATDKRVGVDKGWSIFF